MTPLEAAVEAARSRGTHVAETWIGQIRAAGIEPAPETVTAIREHCFWDRPCGDCAAAIGTAHSDGCDVARCLHTGIQRLQCDGTSDWKPCDCGIEDDEEFDEPPDDFAPEDHTCGQVPHDCGAQAWDGVWPGTKEAVELGIYCYFDKGWHYCGPEHPQADPDLNMLMMVTEWDRERARLVPVEHARALIERYRARGV